MANTAVGNRRHIQLAQGAFPTKGNATVQLVPQNDQVNLHSYSLFNANATAIDVGLGIAFAPVPSSWRLYQYPAGTGVDVTTTIQAGSAVNIFDTTTNHGFIVEAKAPFGFIALNLSQAQSGSPVYVYEYWNGSAWVTLTLSNTPSYTSTGYTYITFQPPVDWAVGDGGLGINTGYSVRARASTAGGQAVIANVMRVARWIAYNAVTAADARFQATFENCPYLLDGGEQLAPYFGTANSLNTYEASFQVNP